MSDILLGYILYILYDILLLWIAGSKWNLEYQFTKAYDVPDLKPKSVRQAAQHILERKTDNKYLRRSVQSTSQLSYIPSPYTYQGLH